MITENNLLIHEMIGLRLEVLQSPDRKKQKMSGVVIDETKNTFVVRIAGDEKKVKEIVVPKNGCVFRFEVNGKKVDVDGNLIAIDPVERPKKLAKHCKVI